MPMPASKDHDVIAWANEQARLLRSGQLDRLDIEHLAQEIEDVGQSEQRELASRMAVSARASGSKLEGDGQRAAREHPTSAQAHAELEAEP